MFAPAAQHFVSCTRKSPLTFNLGGQSKLASFLPSVQTHSCCSGFLHLLCCFLFILLHPLLRPHFSFSSGFHSSCPVCLSAPPPPPAAPPPPPPRRRDVAPRRRPGEERRLHLQALLHVHWTAQDPAPRRGRRQNLRRHLSGLPPLFFFFFPLSFSCFSSEMQLTSPYLLVRVGEPVIVGLLIK